jgi:hypothetical protein
MIFSTWMWQLSSKNETTEWCYIRPILLYFYWSSFVFRSPKLLSETHRVCETERGTTECLKNACQLIKLSCEFSSFSPFCWLPLLLSFPALSFSLSPPLRRYHKCREIKNRNYTFFGIIATSVRLLFKYLSSCMYTQCLSFFLSSQRSLEKKNVGIKIYWKKREREGGREIFDDDEKSQRDISQTLGVLPLFHRCCTTTFLWCCHFLIAILMSDHSSIPFTAA